MSDYRIIDGFAGPGGWDEGLRMIGRTDVLGLEIDEAADATARAAGHHRLDPELADVAALNPLDFGPVEGVVMSPPCQGFSPAGKGHGRADAALLIKAVAEFTAGRDPRSDLREHMADDRSVLALEPIRWVTALRPEWTMWEQVQPVLPLWEACAETLREIGYSVWTGIVHAEQYGVPQTRKRAGLLASRHGDVTGPVATHSRYHERRPSQLDLGVHSWVSMAEALGWGWDDRPARAVCGNRGPRWGYVEGSGSYGTGRTVPEWAYERPATTVQGDARIWPPGHKVNADDRRRLGAEADARYGDRAGTRALRVTVEEAGVLQAFAPDYPWSGNKTDRYQQVGNAVPPLLAAHLGAALGIGTLPQEEIAA